MTYVLSFSDKEESVNNHALSIFISNCLTRYLPMLHRWQILIDHT